MRAIVALPACVIAACRADPASLEGIYSDAERRLVHCAVNLDSSAGVSLEAIDGALDRAASSGEIVHLYAHRPGPTVPVAKLEHVLAGARDRGLAFVTYRDFVGGGVPGPGLALSFDDAGIAEWTSVRPLFQEYGARVTFFVTRYASFTDEGRAQLRDLASDGHDIGAHGVRHLRAPAYVEEHGVRAYLDDEAVPSIDVLRADGYDVTSFAYPYGARTAELDEELARYVPVLRSVEFPVEGVGSPCPR